ncbi:MAG: prepilin-type N-terminal cleavage/methylation domain-containing protein [Candidatus Paceibacterota bacterium]|jgi:prepilin-type N-terminal cleavage/methylation domain-containing protein
MINFFKIKKACPPMRQGISVIEMLIVITVLGIIFSIVIPQFSKSREMQVLRSGVADILSSMDKARGETLSSFNSSSYGVHFQSDKIIIFKGTVFSALDVNNETINIVTPASISNIALVGGGSDFYFNRLSGSPSTTGMVTISTPSYSKTITIYATGVISSN